MIVTLDPTVSSDTVQDISTFLGKHGWKAAPVKTQSAFYLVGIGSQDIDLRLVSHLTGVRDVHRVTDVYKLVSRSWKVKPTRIDLGDGVSIGEGSMTVMAGPCSIEDEKQVSETEWITRRKYHVSMASAIAIPAGTTLTEVMVSYRNPGTGIPAKLAHTVLGKRAARDISADELLSVEMFE
jgi:hypothetical protein